MRYETVVCECDAGLGRVRTMAQIYPLESSLVFPVPALVREASLRKDVYQASQEVERQIYVTEGDCMGTNVKEIYHSKSGLLRRSCSSEYIPSRGTCQASHRA